MSRFSDWLENRITLQNYANPKEETANAATHLAGALLSLIGMFLLVRAGLASGNKGATAGYIIFTLSMLLLYSASGFYHLVKPSNLKRVLRILDHSNIYFLIAGTYTPILIAVGTKLSYAFIAVVWGIAFLGVAFTLIFWSRLKPLHVVLYIAMGWLIVFIWEPVTAVIPPQLMKWIIAGGVTYTVGTGFYSIKKLPFNHAIWHLFVLGGSICFFLGIYWYIPGL
ncbi:PAQR family membrane homeostasis protein TrhA [Spirochaeta isovalerica]|uniref:Hemolysin III n=1 Tax=Spirochaeta isovalerica TaxID=150 RepID=A0A841RI31_9SPIO|nr:hemolysin III family protein [Spirochaeta isovalerica]MBB6482660.1 hemolysin III [Spirochaeta isovalerica]